MDFKTERSGFEQSMIDVKQSHIHIPIETTEFVVCQECGEVLSPNYDFIMWRKVQVYNNNDDAYVPKKQEHAIIPFGVRKTMSRTIFKVRDLSIGKIIHNKEDYLKKILFFRRVQDHSYYIASNNLRLIYHRLEMNFCDKQELPHFLKDEAFRLLYKYYQSKTSRIRFVDYSICACIYLVGLLLKYSVDLNRLCENIRYFGTIMNHKRKVLKQTVVIASQLHLPYHSIQDDYREIPKLCSFFHIASKDEHLVMKLCRYYWEKCKGRGIRFGSLISAVFYFYFKINRFKINQDIIASQFHTTSMSLRAMFKFLKANKFEQIYTKIKEKLTHE